MTSCEHVCDEFYVLSLCKIIIVISLCTFGVMKQGRDPSNSKPEALAPPTIDLSLSEINGEVQACQVFVCSSKGIDVDVELGRWNLSW